MYNLEHLFEDDYIIVEIRKGMYGLPQAGRLAADKLKRILTPHGFVQSEHTPGLWTHKHTDMVFALTVDDFGISYSDKRHVTILTDILAENKYKYSEDWTGE